MNRYLSSLAIVIRKQNFRDSDILYTLLTPTLGKISALAKNIRQNQSKRLSHLQLGNLVKISLYTVNHQYWISEASTLSSFLISEKNLTQFNLLFYFLEILNQSIADNQLIDDIFIVTRNLIESINQNNYPDFINQEIKLLDSLGFGTPDEINNTFKQKDYKLCQQYIKQFLETVIEKPLVSNKLFH
jgi:DNA repair protein RecO